LHLQIIYKRRLQQADAQRLCNERLGIICVLNVAAVDQRKAVELPCVSHTESQARPGKCRERSFLNNLKKRKIPHIDYSMARAKKSMQIPGGNHRIFLKKTVDKAPTICYNHLVHPKTAGFW